jgi:hypothetical protein
MTIAIRRSRLLAGLQSPYFVFISAALIAAMVIGFIVGPV